VTTAWGWYGSQNPQGATSERVVIRNAPHCAILQMYGDNLYGVSGEAPTLTVEVTQHAPQEPAPTSPIPDPPPLPPVPPAGVPGFVATVPNGTILGYYPPQAVITQGSSLTFVNGDNTTHDVTCEERDPVTRKPICGSDYLNAGQTGPVKGVESLPAGTYRFHCSLHSGMVGDLTVL
jgi:plastocyanin